MDDDQPHDHRQTTLVAAGLVGGLLVVAPRPPAALALLRAAGNPSDPTAPLLAVLALLAWGLVAWLALGALLVVGGRLPGACGALSAGLAARALPAALRTSLEVALGAWLVVGTVGGATAQAAELDREGRGLPGAASTSLDWPATGGSAAPVGRTAAGTAAGTGPGPTASVAPPSASPSTAPALAPAPSAAPTVGSTTRPTTTGPTTTQPTASRPVRIAPARASSPGRGAASPSAHVVEPGDTLWDLAERELSRGGRAPREAEVAARWPAWWEANRAAVGDDPHLLRPGTPLLPPAGSAG